jgi:hypothetical protein
VIAVAVVIAAVVSVIAAQPGTAQAVNALATEASAVHPVDVAVSGAAPAASMEHALVRVAVEAPRAWEVLAAAVAAEALVAAAVAEAAALAVVVAAAAVVVVAAAEAEGGKRL